MWSLAVAPKPLNVLVVRDIGLSVQEIAALGVRRISVGGALALAAWTGFMRAAQTLMSEGSFAGLARLVPYAEINRLFAAEREPDTVVAERNKRRQKCATRCGHEPGLEFEDPALRGHRDGVGPIGDVQLQENGLEMRLDGLLGQPELMGDLLVGLSHRDEAQHCHLAFGQRVIGDVRRDFAGDVAMNVAATTMHVANGL